MIEKCKWCGRPPADDDNVCSSCRDEMSRMSNDTLTNAPAPVTPLRQSHGVVSLHFAQLAEKLAQELHLHKPQELDSIPDIEIDMRLATALQKAATQAVRDALSPAVVVKALEEHGASRALDDSEDRAALATSLSEELIDRWRKSP